MSTVMERATMWRIFVVETEAWNDVGSHRREHITINPGSTVADLRALTGNAFAKSPDHFQLIYLGNVLKDSDSLEAAGMSCDSVVLLYSKRQSFNSSAIAKSDLQKNKDKVISCVKALLKRKALHVIGTTGVQMHLLRSMPQLKCSTIAFLLNERLLKKLLQEKKQQGLEEAVREHPALGDALEIVLHVVLTQGVPVVPKQSGNAYSVDALSDDSDDEVDTHGFHQHHTQQRSGGLRIQATGVRTPGQQTSRGAITNEMLQAALQAAYSEQTQVASRTFGPQLAAMREMGLSDERACIQALVRTGGDVDMAVDLLLSE